MIAMLVYLSIYLYLYAVLFKTWFSVFRELRPVLKKEPSVYNNVYAENV